jgi:hypothetical protein
MMEYLVWKSVGQEIVEAREASRDRQRHAHEGVECDGNLLALGALECRLVLSLHQINDHALVALEMSVPVLQSYLVIRPVAWLLEFHVRLLVHAVEVLVKWVEKKVEELLWIMLLVALEHWILVSDHFFELVRRECVTFLVPQLIEQLGVGEDKLPLSA